MGCHPEPAAALVTDEGLTNIELSAYLRRLAALETHPRALDTGTLEFLRGRASALFAVAELVERGAIRDGLLSEPISRLHTPSTPASPAMPDD